MRSNGTAAKPMPPKTTRQRKPKNEPIVGRKSIGETRNATFVDVLFRERGKREYISIPIIKLLFKNDE